VQVLGNTLAAIGFDYDWFLHDIEQGRRTLVGRVLGRERRLRQGVPRMGSPGTGYAASLLTRRLRRSLFGNGWSR
jgi:hypothetical protein